MLLPDILNLPLAAVGLAVAWMLGPGALGDAAIGAAAGFLTFAALAWAYRRLRGRDGLGLGDAKLAMAAGAWVSWTGLPTVVTLAALAALAMVLGRALAGRPVAPTEPVPFGPYLAAGLWLVWLYGPVNLG
jgi:leader peptidase (prepilin peptidase)/N-methyltransferase